VGDTPKPLPKGLRPSGLPFLSNLLEESLKRLAGLTVAIGETHNMELRVRQQVGIDECRREGNRVGR